MKNYIHCLTKDDISFLSELQIQSAKMVGGIIDLSIDDNKNMVIESWSSTTTLRWVFGHNGVSIREIKGRLSHLGITYLQIQK